MSMGSNKINLIYFNIFRYFHTETQNYVNYYHIINIFEHDVIWPRIIKYFIAK